MTGFLPDWKVAPILIAVGTFFIFKGKNAIVTGEYKGKYGQKSTGKSAKVLGWLNIIIGGVFVIASIIDLILRLVSGF